MLIAAVCALIPLLQDPTAVELPGFAARSLTVRGRDRGDLAAVRAERAVWPVSNGRIFAYAGFGEPANRLFMITGPQYQTRGNHAPQGMFGSLWIDVMRDDEPAPPRERTWTEVARAAALRTREVTDGGHVLETLDFALADLPVIVRRVRVERDRRDRARVGLRIRLDDGGDGRATLDEDALVKRYRKDGETFALRVSVRPSPTVSARAVDGTLYVDPVGAAATLEFDVILATSRNAEQRAALERVLAERPIERLQAEALAAWRRQLDGTITAWPDGPIRRHLESVKKLVLAQRSLPSGAVAPMVSFKGVWVRDSNGPVRAFLWMGRPELVRDLLRYHRGASALAGASRREFPLDLRVERVPEPTPAAWADTATDRCEVPSWIVLQHAWYWHATGDDTLIREAFPYLRRNALGQEWSDGPHGPLQRFNGDETYLHGAFYALFPQRGVWPNHFPRASAWSLDSLLTWDAALRAMTTLAQVAGAPREEVVGYATRADAVRNSIEQTFWLPDRELWAPALSPVDLAPHTAPFAPVNLRPLWLGTHTASDPRARANLLTALSLLGRGDGLCRSTPSVAHFIGSLPGYWLVNLAELDHPLAWEVLDDVLASASASGAWAEVHDPDGGAGHSYDATWPNRYRPWESALDMDAVLRFLTGARWRDGGAIELAPRRPKGLALERLGPIAVGRSQLMLHYPSDEGAEDIRVELVAGPPCMVNGTEIQVGRDVYVRLRKPDRQLPDAAPRAYEARLERPAGTRLIVTTLREPDPTPGDVFVDAGLPFAPADLAALLFDADGARRYDAVVLEPWARRADRETMKPVGFWDAPELRDALARFETAGGRVERPDLVSTWWICGPFPNPDSRGLFDEDRPLTAPFDAEQRFAVDGQQVDARWWRKVTPDGRLDLHPPEGPQDDVCVFARTVLQSDRARDATLLLGTDDGCRVWLNGELVFESIEHRHLTPDQFRIPIRLRAGENVLVVGVEDRFGGFGLAARVR